MERWLNLFQVAIRQISYNHSYYCFQYMFSQPYIMQGRRSRGGGGHFFSSVRASNICLFNLLLVCIIINVYYYY